MVIEFNGYRYISEDLVSANANYNLDNNGKRILYNNGQSTSLSNEENNVLNSFQYNEKEFNSYIRKHEYEKAANYLSKFRFNDVETQAEHENDIENLRKEGRKLNGLYGHVNENDLDAVDFSFSVFEDGGLDVLPDENTYKQKFEYFKNRIGGANATTLKVEFLPTKRQLFGINSVVFDALARDKNDVEEFYKKSGLSEEILRANGITIDEENGRPIMIFDKSNKLANTILYNLPYNRTTKEGYIEGLSSGIWITGYDGNGNEIKNQDERYIGATNNNNLFLMQQLVDSSNKTVQNYKELAGNAIKEYSSVVGDFIAPELEQLKRQLANKQITPSEFNTLYKTKFDWVYNKLQNIGSGAYKMYFNGDKNDVLIEADDKQRQEIIKLLSSGDDLTLNSMVCDGEIGTLIEIGATRIADKDIKDNTSLEDMTKGKRWQIFIPGLFTEEAQKQINRNTITRAAQEVNSMQQWGFEYKTVDGISITPNGIDGYIYKKGNNVRTNLSELEAKHIISKDMAILDGQKIKYQYINNNDELVNFNTYNEILKRYSLNVVNELYPYIDLIDIYGNVIDLDTAFNNMSFAGTEVNDTFSRNINSQVRNKLNELYSVYNNILKSVDYYIRNNKYTY